MQEVAVSVVCNAYNHESYIRDALEGFVMQETTFPFEILIHDDASTDKTADIIREYEMRFPEIIKPIYESENQYSKQDGSLGRIQYGRVKGKYIAVCEGDDCWIDKNKLQRQYDYLESHPDINVCAHAVKMVDYKTGNESLIMPSKQNCIFDVKDVIRGGGGFVGTCSLFYRKSLRDNLPDFVKFFNIDYSQQVAYSFHKGMYFDTTVMGLYRFRVPGSWTSTYIASKKSLLAKYDKWENLLLMMNKETNGKYVSEISYRMIIDNISMYLPFMRNIKVFRRYIKAGRLAVREHLRVLLKIVLSLYFGKVSKNE